MADNTDISQAISELGADSSTAQTSQAVSELGASASEAQISQAATEIGADASTAQISQLPIEIGASASTAQISQLTIELGRGPEVIPPADNPVGTFTVGAGLGLTWFLALQLSDSGEERRDKVVKSFRATGKFTNALLKGYTYGPMEDINVENIEDGVGQKVTVALTDTTQVQQTKRFQVNLPNAMMHTGRIEGTWDGEGIPDRVDEIIYEVSRQGIRR